MNSSENDDSHEANPKIGIVASQFNQEIVNRLLDGCLKTLSENGIEEESIRLIKVPGAFEIPVVVNKMLIMGDIDVIITLGAIIRGETPHFDIITNCCSLEIARISTDALIPVIFGVLTVDTIKQALDRSGEEESNKGSEAANAAIKMVRTMNSLKSLK